MKCPVLGLILCVVVLGAHGRPISIKQDVQHAGRDAIAEARSLGRAAGHQMRSRGTSPRPVFLVPGIGGSVLEQKLQNVQQPYALCSSTMDWTRVWMRLTNLLPYEFECFANTIAMTFEGRWLEKSGVSTRPGAGLDAVNYLDNRTAITRKMSSYFEAASAALIAAGWKEQSTLFGVPYDWRRLPSSLNGTWIALRTSIEDSVARTSQRAILVTHSMGALMIEYFLANIVSTQWKDAHIHSWISIAGPFGGAPVAVKSVLSGYNFGIPVLTSAEGYLIGSHVGSNFLLFPKPGHLPASWFALSNGASILRNYSSSELGDLLRDAKVNVGPEKLAHSQDEWSLTNPGVPIILAVGTNVDTASGYVYNVNSVSSGPTFTAYSSGDGTVPMESASLPMLLGWNASLFYVKNADHVGMLSNPSFLKWLLQQVTR